MQNAPQYEVLSPLGAGAQAARSGISAPPLDRLAGKRIGLVWTVFPNGNLILEAFEKLLGARYNDASFVRLPPGRGLLWGQNPHPSLTEVVREERIDAVIVAAGC